MFQPSGCQTIYLLPTKSNVICNIFLKEMKPVASFGFQTKLFPTNYNIPYDFDSLVNSKYCMSSFRSKLATMAMSMIMSVDSILQVL